MVVTSDKALLRKSVMDSSRESSVIAWVDSQTDLQDFELARGQQGAQAPGLAYDLARSRHGVGGAVHGHRNAVLSGVPAGHILADADGDHEPVSGVIRPGRQRRHLAGLGGAKACHCPDPCHVSVFWSDIPA